MIPDEAVPPTDATHSLQGELRLVGRHSLIYMLGPALSNVVGFVMIPVYTRFITSSEFGIMSLVDVVMTLAMMVLAFGVSDGMTRFYYGETEEIERRRLVSSAIVGPALLSLPIILVAILAADWLRQPLGIGPEYVAYLRLALATAWCSMLAEIGYSYLRMCYLSRTVCRDYGHSDCRVRRVECVVRGGSTTGAFGESCIRRSWCRPAWG